MKVGDLVKYMSRMVLIVEIGEEWVYGMELGENTVAKYKAFALREIN